MSDSIYAIMLGPVWIMAPSLPDPTLLLVLAIIGGLLWRIKRRKPRPVNALGFEKSWIEKWIERRKQT